MAKQVGPRNINLNTGLRLEVRSRDEDVPGGFHQGPWASACTTARI